MPARARSSHLLAAGLLGWLALASCTLGPRYQRPAVETPANWRGGSSQGTAQSAAWPSVQWWQGFGSDDLNTYMSQAQKANDDLAAAIARVREADAQARVAGAPLYPSVSAGASATRERAQASTGGLKTYNFFEPGLSASYELDFWGKNRAALEAATAAANASRFDRATVELTVMAGVANTYFLGLELRDRVQIAHENLASAEQIQHGLRLERTAGTATGLDVAQQETTVATLDAAIPPLEEQLRQANDALAILLGRAPQDVDIARGKLDEIKLPEVRPGLPSELLARRPDIAEAEAQLIAANANISVARAAFFPSISLTGSGGFESAALAGLMTPGNRVWSIGAGLTQPIFEGGALRGQLEYSKARYDELLANYHKAILTAFANVEDSLVALRQTAEQQSRQQKAVEQARRAFDFAQAQMRAGTINILTLLNTQAALFTAQDALAQVKYAHLQALVNLFQALGGGWQMDETEARSPRP